MTYEDFTFQRSLIMAGMLGAVKAIKELNEDEHGKGYVKKRLNELYFETTKALNNLEYSYNMKQTNQNDTIINLK